mmetsp:Transcript_27957/g.45686  ORF Transcript_27957/g.45686 Transcript_27957/m.45686 type:complete len:109 (-) Transcript_27957:1418-1744(-)
MVRRPVSNVAQNACSLSTIKHIYRLRPMPILSLCSAREAAAPSGMRRTEPERLLLPVESRSEGGPPLPGSRCCSCSADMPVFVLVPPIVLPRLATMPESSAFGPGVLW